MIKPLDRRWTDQTISYSKRILKK